MKYSINEEVLVINSNLPKTIEDSEIIDGEEIYYMTDKTSYHSDQIQISKNKFIESEKRFCPINKFKSENRIVKTSELEIIANKILFDPNRLSHREQTAENFRKLFSQLKKPEVKEQKKESWFKNFFPF